MIVVASTKYPPHNTHMIWGLSCCKGILRSDIAGDAMEDHGSETFYDDALGLLPSVSDAQEANDNWKWKKNNRKK